MKPTIVRRQSAFVRATARIFLACLFLFAITSEVSCQNHVDSNQIAAPDLVAAKLTQDSLKLVSQKLDSLRQDSLNQISLSQVSLKQIALNQASLDSSFACRHPAALRGIVILLDAGHGGRQDGALYDSIAEKNVNLAVTFKLKARLELMGARVHMTRTDDRDLSLEARVAKSKRLKPDIFVSVHANANRHTSIDGIETYYYGRRSSVLAATLLKSISSGLNENANWMKHELLYVLHHNIVPSTLVEIGYLSNSRTNKLLNTNGYQERVAESIALGVFNYFQLKKPARGPLVRASKAKSNRLKR